MSRSRREFLAAGSATLLASAAAAGAADAPRGPTPGAPPAFGTAPPVGPVVTADTFGEAQKLLQVEFNAAERAQAAQNWRVSLASMYERRTGPRKLALPSNLPPYALGHARLPGGPTLPVADRFVHSTRAPGALPDNDVAIAFAPVWQLSRWLAARELTSERLTTLYLERIARFDPQLRAVITLTPELALEQARRADREIAAGRYRGALHGMPWGAKDLLDTAGIRTTYGAEPFRDRVPQRDAVVVQRLHEAGAVLLAKLSLGALALNDIWFGGQTMNPWLLEEGASGSSAGPAAALAAGLVAFAIGSETEGSIVSPSMRCGVTGLRPTFGRVPRTGSMPVAFSLDKLGPMARSVEDTMLVLHAICGPDPGDLASVSSPLDFDAARPIRGLRLGYFPAWMQDAAASEVNRQALQQLRALGLEAVEVEIPDWPYATLNTLLFAEVAAAFEELTLSRGIDQLKVQLPDAWPNTLRQSRFLSAVDYVQADKFRRLVAQQMQRVLSQVDLLLVPSLRAEMLTIGNFVGLPSLTLRAGFVEVAEARSDWAPDPQQPLPRFDPPRRVPYGVTLVGQLFDEGTLARVGLGLERALQVDAEQPPGFGA